MASLSGYVVQNDNGNNPLSRESASFGYPPTPAITKLTQYGEQIYDHGNKNSNFNVSFLDGSAHKVTVTGACAVTFTDWMGTVGYTQSIILHVVNGGTNITFPGVKWAGGNAPALTAAGQDRLVFTTDDNGTTIFGFVAGLDIK